MRDLAAARTGAAAAGQAGAGAAAKAGAANAATSTAGKAAGAAGKAAGAANGAATLAKKPQDTHFQSGVRKQMEQRTRQLANEATKRAVQAAGGVTVVDKLAGQLADKAVGKAIKITAAAAGMWTYIVAAALAGAVVLTFALNGPALSRFPLPGAPTKEQSESMPPGWADVAYRAQENTKTSKFGVPWTVLAGLMKVQSDFGRASPYDTVDRDPERDPKFGPPPGMQGSSGLVVSAGAYTGPVLVVGDDLVTGIKASLTTKLSNQLDFDTSPGRSTESTVAAITARKGSLPGAVVVSLGSRDDVSTATFTGYVDRVMAAAGASTTVYWLTVHNGAAPEAAAAVNAALQAGKGRHANLTLIDWASAAGKNPAWLEADKVTPTTQGYQQRARLVADAIAAADASTGFQMPLPADTRYRVSSVYGMRIHPVTGVKKMHTGRDFAAKAGTPILAAAAGTVLFTGDSGDYGNLTKLGHPDGLQTWYAHQTKFLVKPGDQVQAGQQIGTVGSTGRGTGAHLHFEVRLANGTKHQDPVKYLPGGANHPGSDANVSTGLLPAEGVVAAGSCAVDRVDPTIGNGRDQGAGPLLLRPEVADRMREKGKDPNNACEAAEFVAAELVETGTEVMQTGNYSQWKDGDDAARSLWSTVIARANLFADPNSSSVDCSVPISGELDVAYAIESIVTCEAQRASKLEVAVDANVAADGKVTFDTVTDDAAAALLVNEALDVSYAFSKFDLERCDNAAPLTGLFPLPADVATKYGAADRCDPQSAIRAAARALIAGETTPVTKRAATGGPFAPMVGGWASMPWALGTQGVTGLATRGPYTPWESNSRCDAAVKAWLAAAVNTGVPEGNLAPFLAKVPGNPRTSVCGSPSEAEFAQQVTPLAESLAGDSLERLAAETQAADAKGLGPAWEVDGGEQEEPVDVDPKTADAYGRLALHFARVRSSTGPAAATAATDSLVARLSTNGAAVSPAPRSSGFGSTFTFPTATAALDHAVFYGGIRPEWETFGTEVGVVGQVVGTGYPMTAGGDAAVVIAAAKKWLGTPYSWGGGDASGPTHGQDDNTNIVGFDCSGLVEYAFAAAGIKLTGSTRDQIKKGTTVPTLAQGQPGDLIFWDRGRVHHVAIYLGDGKVIHAPRRGKTVEIRSVWSKDTIVIKRHLTATSVAGPGVPAGQWKSALPAAGQQYAALFEAAGAKYKVEPQLMAGLAWQESHFAPDVVRCQRPSHAGALGLMQFIPPTAAEFGIDPCDPAQAVDAGTQYIAQLYKQFGSVQLALAAYNAGPARVQKYKGVPPFKETRDYVDIVVNNCRKLGGRCT